MVFSEDVSESSRPEMLSKKGAVNKFTKFTGKHLCRSLFKIKLQASGLKKRRFVSVNFAKILRTLSFIERIQWLPLPPTKVFLRIAIL